MTTWADGSKRLKRLSAEPGHGHGPSSIATFRAPSYVAGPRFARRAQGSSGGVTRPLNGHRSGQAWMASDQPLQVRTGLSAAAGFGWICTVQEILEDRRRVLVGQANNR